MILSLLDVMQAILNIQTGDGPSLNAHKTFLIENWKIRSKPEDHKLIEK